MTHLKRHLRFFLAAIGFVLAAVGLAAGYWWHYKLAPMRHLADPAWLAAHSEAARWEEEQKDYRRLGSSPDLCFRGDRIGFYGDKQWFLWLDERIRNPESFRHCGCTEYALALMANRHVDSWAKWTDANRDRSQEEWIRDGFSEHGVTVHVPPASDDTLPLLRLLGRKSWNVLGMKARIRELLQASPFQPFVIRMAHGREYRIEHPDFVLASSSDVPQITIEEPDGRHHFLSALLVTSIERISGLSVGGIQNGQ